MKRRRLFSGTGRAMPPRARLRRRRGLRARRVPVRRLTLSLGLGGVGMLAGYLVATTHYFPAPEPPPGLQGVPDVRGMPMGAAVALLGDSGLSVTSSDSVRHPIAPAGSVIGQSPLPGRTALPGAGVRLTRSLGPEVRSVPDLTRLRGARATAALEAGGFEVEVDTVESEVQRGWVVAIDPIPGTRVGIPATVRLSVSRGPPSSRMPSLAGLARAEAEALVSGMGLLVGAVERRYSILNVGRVFAQRPAAGAQVQAGASVRLIVGQEMLGSPARQPRKPFIPNPLDRPGRRPARDGD